MNRRGFLRAAVGGSTAIAAGCAARPPLALPPRRAGLRLGTQQGPTSDEMLQYFAQLGVEGICGYTESWKADDLKRLRERVESWGLRLEALSLPLTSKGLGAIQHPNIMLGKSPARDREIDDICGMIRAAGAAGIPVLKYNLNILGVVRTGRTPGRGGSGYSTFRWEDAKKRDGELTAAGRVEADASWERIEYFLARVIPVAEEHRVRMACHPHDPPMPPEGYRGVARVLGSVEGLKRFVEIHASPYHGLNFCQGTISEGLENPRKDILDVIRYFGERKKIFNVHFRNIRGRFLDFQEVYPDEGDVDMLAAARVYKDVGYDGLLMPDHVPHMAGDEGGRQAFAFALGYIRGLIQAAMGHS
jgi:mannonate dehydratase